MDTNVVKLIEKYKAQEPSHYDNLYIKRYELGSPSLSRTFKDNHFEWPEVVRTKILGKRILDFGCGMGQHDIVLAKQGYTIMGIEPSRLAVEIAQYFLSLEDDEIKSRVSFLNVPVGGANETGQRFSSIWSSHVFEHLVDINETLGYIKREWAAEGARMLISVPYGKHFDSPDHKHYWHSTESLKDELGQYLKPIHVTHNEQFHVIRFLGTFL